MKLPYRLGKKNAGSDLEMLTSNIECDVLHGSKPAHPLFSHPVGLQSVGTACWPEIAQLACEASIQTWEKECWLGS